jgi:5-methylcytosine-specific restriction endonuclease McrA
VKIYADAIVAGDAQYLGKACKKAGHIGIRFVSNRTCVSCLAEAAKTLKRKAQLKLYCQQPKIREYQKQYQKEYATTEKYKIQKQEYRKRNTAKLTAKVRKYQASKIHRTPVWLTKDDFWMIEEAYELAALRTRITGIAWHVDHVIPLQGEMVSGLHTPYNLQVIVGKINQSKSNYFAVT